MSIWTQTPDLHAVNQTHLVGLATHLGMRLVACTDDSLSAALPISDALRQPQGLLNGGATAAAAEILGGIAGDHCLDGTKFVVVGQELNISHLRSVREGSVLLCARPLRLGRRSQVWDIRCQDDSGALTAIVRLTNAILERREATA